MLPDIFPVFQLAVEVKKASIADIMLDCLQQLIARQHIQGVVTAVSTSLKQGPPKDTTSSEMEEENEGGCTVVDANTVSYATQVMDMICKYVEQTPLELCVVCRHNL